jgi:hypothetical protein
MDARTDAPSTPAPAEVSLVRGGPFYLAEQAVGLIRPDRWNLGRRIAAFIAIGWLPLLLITALLNPEGLRSFLWDYRAHARLLIAVPTLLIGEIVMDARFREVSTYIRQAALLDAPDMAYMDSVVATLVRLRDAFLPELIVLVLLIVRIATSYRGLVDTTPWMGQELGANYHFTAAGWYAVVVSVPIFNFLLGLAFWRWLLWTFFAFRLSRRKLKLVATHPDKHGGLGFLGLTAAAFAPIAFAITSAIAATYRHDILLHGAHLMDYKLPAIVLVVIIVVIALAPLLFFVPRLTELRRKGILEYGILGQLHSMEYHEKWIRHRAGHEAEFLLAPETNLVAGYGKTYESIGDLKPLPVDLGSLYALAAAVVIPALFVILTEIPFAVVLEDLMKAVR